MSPQPEPGDSQLGLRLTIVALAVGLGAVGL